MTDIGKFEKMENDHIERWKAIELIHEDSTARAATTNSIGSTVRRAGIMEEYTQRAKAQGLSRREYLIIIVSKTHPQFIRNIYTPQEGRSFYVQFGDYLMETDDLKFIDYLSEYLRRVR